jgi:hypothetical protein
MNKLIRSLLILFFGLPFAHSQDLRGQLGILDLTANGGLNPATGAPWVKGDQYRFVFVTSTTTNAVSTDLNEYNNFVQSVANSSIMLPQLKTVTWKVLGSTTNANQDAKTNTATDPAVNGSGEAIFLLDGQTVFADGYTSLWSSGKTNALTITEELTTQSGSVFSGTAGNGSLYNQPLGGNALNAVGHGTCTRTDGVAWILIFNSNKSSFLPFYAMSEPLTVVPPGGTVITLY